MTDSGSGDRFSPDTTMVDSVDPKIVQCSKLFARNIAFGVPGRKNVENRKEIEKSAYRSVKSVRVRACLFVWYRIDQESISSSEWYQSNSEKVVMLWWRGLVNSKKVELEMGLMNFTGTLLGEKMLKSSHVMALLRIAVKKVGPQNLVDNNEQ